MKEKILFFGFVLLSINISFAQKSNIGDGKWSIGGGIEMVDFFSPMAQYKYGFKQPLLFGPKVFVWKNFNSSFSLSLDINTIFKKKEIDEALPLINAHLLNVGIGGVYKFNNGYIFKESSFVAPYFFARIQGSLIEKHTTLEKKFGIGFPIGAGINWRLMDDLALQTQAGYTFGITKEFENHIFYSVGIVADIRKKQVEVKPIKVDILTNQDIDEDGVLDIYDNCPTIAGKPEFNGCPDSDGDGVEDSKDECPLVFGLISMMGCPDSDGDGISDNIDLCPNEKGIAKLSGCPEVMTDSDEDGVFDINDDCPTLFGTKENKGCPEVDTDKDGVPDKNDKCPLVAGFASNNGCPLKTEVEQGDKKIMFDKLQFKIGKSVLDSQSIKILDDIVQLMKNNKELNIRIEGYTDNTGSAALNKSLSTQRGDIAKAYLIDKNIEESRIKTIGLGAENPIGDNITPEGRSKNRRTEFFIY